MLLTPRDSCTFEMSSAPNELAQPGAGKRSKRGVRVESWLRHHASNAAASPTNRGASSRKRSGALAGRT